MAVPDLPAWVPTGLMVNQCSDEDCCGNGKICPRCNFGVSDCRVWWDCPDEVVETEVYRDTTLISTDSYGVIGQPTVGQYRIRRRCNGIWYSELMGTVGSAICGNCCESIGRNSCDAPVVLTLSGLPPYPAWDGWNGSFVMDCSPFASICFRQLSLLKGEYAPCTGSLATESPDGSDYHVNDYGLFIVWNSSVGTGPLGRVGFSDGGYYSKKNSPTSCDRYFGLLGNGTGGGAVFNTTSCKLPITGSMTLNWPVGSYGGGFVVPTFSDFFGPPRSSGETYTFDFSIE